MENVDITNLRQTALLCDQDGGVEALQDRSPETKTVWNRVPDDKRGQIIKFAVENEDLTPRELAVKFTDTKHYFVSESTVYRRLKEHAPD